MSGVDFFGRLFRNPTNERMSDYGSFAKAAGDVVPQGPDATLVTSSLGRGDLHAPVIDLDIPHHYEPSTTPGHGHLYLNKAMPWGDLVKLLNALCEVGVIEHGFRGASMERGYASVRTPWTKKPGVA